jgi:hypothetical protein
MQVYARAIEGKIKWSARVKRPLKALLRPMLLPALHKRLSKLKDIKQQPFLAGVPWEAVGRRRARPPFCPTLAHAGDCSGFEKFDEKPAARGGAPGAGAAAALSAQVLQRYFHDF